MPSAIFAFKHPFSIVSSGQYEFSRSGIDSSINYRYLIPFDSGRQTPQPSRGGAAMATLHDQEATIIVTTTALLMHLDTRFQDTSLLSSVGLVKYLNRSPEWKCIGRQRCREARRWNSFLKMEYCQSDTSLVPNICYLELSTELREISQCTGKASTIQGFLLD